MRSFTYICDYCGKPEPERSKMFGRNVSNEKLVFIDRGGNSRKVDMITYAKDGEELDLCDQCTQHLMGKFVQSLMEHYKLEVQL